MTFTAELRLEGKTATGIVVPDSYIVQLGGGKRPAVVVTLAGRYTYRSTVMPYDGLPMLPVAAHPQARAAYEKLAPSHKKAHVESILGAKTVETRQRRLEKLLAALGAGRDDHAVGK